MSQRPRSGILLKQVSQLAHVFPLITMRIKRHIHQIKAKDKCNTHASNRFLPAYVQTSCSIESSMIWLQITWLFSSSAISAKVVKGTAPCTIFRCPNISIAVQQEMHFAQIRNSCTASHRTNCQTWRTAWCLLLLHQPSDFSVPLLRSIHVASIPNERKTNQMKK